MENTVFDVFSSVKNLLFLGNYDEAITENEANDITEDESTLLIRKKFYLFMAYLEEDKQTELNDLLQELKDSQDNSKIYFNIFRIYLVFFIKKTYKEDVLTKVYNDLIGLEKVNTFLQPAVYLISLILLQLDDRERFLNLTQLLLDDPEILILRIHYFLKMNKPEEAFTLVESLNIKDSDSISTSFCSAIVDFFKDVSVESALKTLAEIKSNNKMTPKLFNTISVALMCNGQFKEAIKPLNLGIEACMKTGSGNYDLNCMLVNLINCCRNCGLESELRDTEEKLKSLNPNDLYFAKLKEFEDEFEKCA